MTTKALAVLLGLVASFLFAGAAYLQQRAARQTMRQGHGAVGALVKLMLTLVRDRVWFFGWLVNLAGFAFQAAALHVGSVATVQPLLATQLLFALPMSSLERRRWPQPRDWASGLAVSGGLVLLLVVVNARPLEGEPDRTKIVIAVACELALIVIAMPIAFRLPSELLSLAAGVGAGLCFSMTAVFLKLTSDDLAVRGVGYTATDWVGYALAGSTLLGLVLEQAAFANGPLPWAIATKESVNPVASYAIGVLAFPTALPGGTIRLLAMGGAGALVVLGTIGLAHSPSSEVWQKRGSEDPDTRMQ